MMSESRNDAGNTYVSLGVIAWNEEAAIRPMLESLFRQTLFAELAQRNRKCEVLCVANGCTDRTTAVCAEIFDREKRTNPAAQFLSFQVADLPERGKLNAWNQFVHSLSCPSAKFLFLMDADILLHETGTLCRMLELLERDPQANVAVDTPRKDIYFKARRSWHEKLSLSAAEVTSSAQAQLCAQLYGIRAEVARNIYLPKDLFACEDGFIKQIVCTDFLTREVFPDRIRLAEGAEHTFEAYTSTGAIFKNQKRQIIGQTLVHLLADEYLRALPLSQRLHLAATIKEHERANPSWLKDLIREHLRKKRFFWQLYPGLLTHRFHALARLTLPKRLRCLPAAAAGSLVTFAAAYLAYKTLRTGSTDYWPRAKRVGLKPPEADGNRNAVLTAAQELNTKAC